MSMFMSISADIDRVFCSHFKAALDMLLTSNRTSTMSQCHLHAHIYLKQPISSQYFIATASLAFKTCN